MRPYWEIFLIDAVWTDTRPSHRSTFFSATWTASSSADLPFQKSRTSTWCLRIALATGFGRPVRSADLAAAAAVAVGSVGFVVVEVPEADSSASTPSTLSCD